MCHKSKSWSLKQYVDAQAKKLSRWITTSFTSVGIHYQIYSCGSEGCAKLSKQRKTNKNWTCSGEGLSVEGNCSDIFALNGRRRWKQKIFTNVFNESQTARQKIKDKKIWGLFSNLSHFLVFVTSSSSVQSTVPDVPTAPQSFRLLLNKWGLHSC